MRKLVTSMLGWLALVTSVNATTITIPNPGNNNDITAAITTAVTTALNGDVIYLPEGTFTLSGTVTITKFISVQGAGIGKTVLFRDASIADGALYDTPMLLFDINSSAPSNIKVADITFRSKAPDKSRAEDMAIQIIKAIDFRITRCRFEYFGNTAVFVRHTDKLARGLIDRNEFYHNRKGSDGLGEGYGVAIYGADSVWIDKVNFGSDNFIFIEDNTFDHHRHSIAAGGAALYVARYNTITNNLIADSPYTHAIDGHPAHGGVIGSENYLSTRAVEVYNNTIINTTHYDGTPIGDNPTINKMTETCIEICGGEAIVHNNTISGYRFASGVNIGDYPWGESYPIKYATGYWSGLTQGPTHTGTDAVNGEGDGFYWDNKYTPYHTDPEYSDFFHNYVTKHIQEHRDYHFVAKPGYTPYKYPHPLASSSTSQMILSASSEVICLGKSTTLTASGSVAYLWAPAIGLSATTGATVIAKPDASTTYTVTGTDNSGNVTRKTITVTVRKAPIAGGGSHSAILYCGSCPNGGISATGLNSYGQLALGNSKQTTVPKFLKGLIGVTAVATGSNHTLFLKSDGTVWASGLNSSGQLGDGTIANRTAPVQVKGLSGIIAIAAGNWHSLFLKNDGTVWACGYNGAGQLGDGSTVNRSISVQVSGLTGIVAIAAGAGHSIYLKSDSLVKVCGKNTNGQLGDGTTISKSLPITVRMLSGIKAIAAGGSHSLFLQGNGTVKATGLNTSGQLGDGTTTQQIAPVEVSNLTNIAQIAAGGNHSLFLKDKVVWATGSNTFGQLGDATTTTKNTPVQVSSLTVPIIAIAAGTNHSLFLEDNNTVWAAGLNKAGQLGNGTNVNASTAVTVTSSGTCGSLSMAAPEENEEEGTITDTALEALGIYPNPADGELNIQLPQIAEEKTTLTLVDALGRSVLETQFNAGELLKRIVTKELTPGIYFLRIQGEQELIQQKIIINHNN